MSDLIYETVISKIDDGTVSCDDFNLLIKESTPEAIRDRLRRRNIVNVTKTHLDDDGHQQLELPEMNMRVQPKRKPDNQQGHGIADLAHKASVRTQARQQKFTEEIQFIQNNIGKPIEECDWSDVDQRALLAVANKIMELPKVNRNWLSRLCQEIKHGRQ